MCSDDVPEHDEIAVGLAHVLQLEHRAAALRAGREREVDALALRRDLDRHDLLEQLDAALDLRGLRCLVAEAVDEHLDARDLLVLLALRLPQALEHRVALRDVLAVVADVVGQLAQVEVGDARDDRVEEVAIVRDEDDGVRIRAEIFLEPVARLEIEVVRRLVEQQQVRPAEQQLRQRDAHLPPAGERLGRAREILLAEAEAAQHRRDPQIHAVAVCQPEAILQVAVAVKHRVVLRFRHRRVAEPMLDVVHLRLDVEQRLEGAGRFLEDACGRVCVRPSWGR